MLNRFIYKQLSVFYFYKLPPLIPQKIIEGNGGSQTQLGVFFAELSERVNKTLL
jgi:hypothetical protein